MSLSEITQLNIKETMQKRLFLSCHLDSCPLNHF